jgi:hypothetical protein
LDLQTFGVAVKPETLSLLRLLGVLPLVAAGLALYMVKQFKTKGVIMASGLAIYLLYQLGLTLFVFTPA